MIYVNVTTEDGELLGRFEVDDQDIRRAGSIAIQQSVGRSVFDQLPAAMFEPPESDDPDMVWAWDGFMMRKVPRADTTESEKP